MEGFFDLIVDFFSSIILVLNRYTFYAFGFQSSLAGILIAFLLIGFAINFFWKGARA